MTFSTFYKANSVKGGLGLFYIVRGETMNSAYKYI